MAQHVSYIFQTPSTLHCPHDEVFWAVYVFGRCSLEKPLQGPLNRSSNHQVMLSDVLPAIKGSCVHHCNFLAQYLTCFTKWYHKAKKSSCNNSNFSLNTVFFPTEQHYYASQKSSLSDERYEKCIIKVRSSANQYSYNFASCLHVGIKTKSMNIYAAIHALLKNVNHCTVTIHLSLFGWSHGFLSWNLQWKAMMWNGSVGLDTQISGGQPNKSQA